MIAAQARSMYIFERLLALDANIKATDKVNLIPNISSNNFGNSLANINNPIYIIGYNNAFQPDTETD